MPDSLLQDFCAYINEHEPAGSHIIAANEGNAVALAAGHHLATGSIGLVYMQNSGLGNIINPVASLIDPLVYSIPALFLIGWRGEPGIKDEPQHIKQGIITLDLLDVMGVKHAILPQNIDQAQAVITDAVEYMNKNNAPYALVVSKNTFEPYSSKNSAGVGEEAGSTAFPLTREEVLKMIISQMHPEDIVVSTTGKTSREIYEYREELNQGHSQDFLTVGSMGHSSQIALGIALAKPDRNIYCIDGDGSLLMHMGALAITGDLAPPNYRHILINNGAHESVGGQPTVALKIDIPTIAQACGYKTALQATTKDEVLRCLKTLNSAKAKAPALLEIKVKKGARENLGRPTTTPTQNKKAFMKHLST